MKKYHSEIIDYIKRFEDSELKEIDLSQFLKYTEKLDSDRSEKLRQLAIAIEEEFYFDDEQKWNILNTIYQRAIDENPTDAIVYESRGISASLLCELNKNEVFKKELLDIVERSFTKSYELGNNDVNLQYSWGYHYYPSNYVKAMEKFENALKIQPNHAKSNMYVGYINFDLQNWLKAIVAFKKVNVQELRGYWEKIKRLELIGCAQIESGDVEIGLNFLKSNVISQYEMGRYNSEDIEYDLAHPTEMIRTLKDRRLSEMVEKIEKLL